MAKWTPSKESEFEAKSPDYSVSMLNKLTSEKGNIGVAWQQNDGSIRIKLNSFLKFPNETSELVITCWPNQPVPRKGVSKPQSPKHPIQQREYDDGIPF